jgi:hypothetical protein
VAKYGNPPPEGFRQGVDEAVQFDRLNKLHCKSKPSQDNLKSSTEPRLRVWESALAVAAFDPGGLRCPCGQSRPIAASTRTASPSELGIDDALQPTAPSRCWLNPLRLCREVVDDRHASQLLTAVKTFGLRRVWLASWGFRAAAVGGVT